MLKAEFIQRFLSSLKTLTTHRDFANETDFERYVSRYGEHPTYPNQESVMINDDIKTKVPLASIPWADVSRIHLYSDVMMGYYQNRLHLILNNNTFIDCSGDILNKKEVEMNEVNLAALCSTYNCDRFNADSLILFMGTDQEYMFSVHWDKMSREDFFEEVSLDVPLCMRTKLTIGKTFQSGEKTMRFGQIYFSVEYWNDQYDQAWYYTKENVQNVVAVIKSCI